MLAAVGPRPHTLGRDWAVEMKWDGVRAISHCHPAKCRIYSRNSREISAQYPELAESLLNAANGRDLILDGEIVAPGPTGAPVFERLQRRMHVTRVSPALIAAVPVRYFVFDLLTLDGEPILHHPYLERRRLLEALHLDTDLIRVPPYWLDADQDRMLAAAAESGLEGIVLKRTDAGYSPGRRSPAWIKVPLRRSTDAVVIGFQAGTGSNTATFGSLVLAAHDPQGRLRFLGSVGTGFTRPARQRLREVLDRLRRDDPPLADPPKLPAAVTWVRPLLVALVEYRELTGDGVLRQPSFLGLHSDRSADSVVLPE